MKYYFFVYYKDDYWSQKYKIGERKFHYGKDWHECIKFKNKKIKKKDRGKKTYYKEISPEINFDLIDPGENKLDLSVHECRDPTIYRMHGFGHYQLNDDSISFYKTGSNQNVIEMKVILGPHGQRILYIDKRGRIYENTYTWDGHSMRNHEIIGIEFAIDMLYFSRKKLYVLYPWGQVVKYDHKYDYYHDCYHTTIITITSPKTLGFVCKKFYGDVMIANDHRRMFIKHGGKMVPIEINYNFQNIKCISKCGSDDHGNKKFCLYDGESLYLLTVDMSDRKTLSVKKIINDRDIVSLHTFRPSTIVTKN